MEIKSFLSNNEGIYHFPVKLRSWVFGWFLFVSMATSLVVTCLMLIDEPIPIGVMAALLGLWIFTWAIARANRSIQKIEISAEQISFYPIGITVSADAILRIDEFERAGLSRKCTLEVRKANFVIYLGALHWVGPKLSFRLYK